MKLFKAFVTVGLLFSSWSATASTLSFTESENRMLRSVLNSIAPIKTADKLYCSISESEMPGRDSIVFCGVDYTDPSRWLAKFRTKWISSRVLNLLLSRGHCEYVEGAWEGSRPDTKKPYRCQLLNVSCAPEGCSAN